MGCRNGRNGPGDGEELLTLSLLIPEPCRALLLLVTAQGRARRSPGPAVLLPMGRFHGNLAVTGRWICHEKGKKSCYQVGFGVAAGGTGRPGRGTATHGILCSG